MRPTILRRLGILGAAVALVLCAGCTGALPVPPVATQPPSAAATAAVSQPPSAEATVATLPSAPRPDPKPPAPAPSKKPTSSARNPRLYPNPTLTPGDVLPVSAAQVSVAGYASRVRNVPVSEKRDVYAEYHLAYPQKTGSYECDHFIPLCLGGSNSIKNLWPEPAPEFHWKDGLEVYLWRQVRAGRVGLAEAQREIRTDWYAYWVKAGKPGSTGDADSAVVQSAAAPVGASSRGTIVGWSVSGARYHYLSCRYFAQIKPGNRRTGTVAQAKAAEKTPCLVCRSPGN
jgi:hypothetical protein